MKKFDTINVIPFIDIMLVLLAIVLATASFISQGKIEVNVPKSQSKVKVKQDELAELITINKDGDFFYQDKAITIPLLDEALAKIATERKITIKIDAETDFQQFVKVTDLLTKYGLKKVAVVTSPVSQGKQEVPAAVAPVRQGQ
ncbi:MAG: TonB system transport protein ExbD [Gammaproteobacteria bacterium]|nr:MAG: TonB system transport protein ExbD [Gammaproteobacteria bacterium]